MSSQNSFFANLIPALTNTAAYNNSQYGQTGNGVIDKIRPVLDFLGGAYAAHAANPAAGGTAIAGLGNAIQGASRRNYMNQIQKQYQYEQLMKDAQRQQMGGYLGVDPNGPFQGRFYGDNEAAKTALETLGRRGSASSVNGVADGNPLNVDPFTPTDVTQGLGTAYLRQQGAATNYANAGPGGAGAMQIGQNNSLAFPKPQPEQPTTPPVAPAPTKSLGGPGGALSRLQQPAGLDMGDTQPSVLSTGTSYAQPPVRIDTGMSPFLLPTDIPDQIATSQRSGMQDAQQNAQLGETAQHNRATEANTAYGNQTGRLVYQATKNNQGGYAHYAPTPPQPTNASLAAGVYANDPAGLKRYLENGGSSGGNDPTEALLRNNVNTAKAAYGEKSPQAKAAYDEYNAYVGRTQNSAGYQFANPQTVQSMFTNPAAQFTGSGSGAVQAMQNTGTRATGSVKSAWHEFRARNNR